ncbi:type II and III secretion system protein family protein [Aliiruegeria sabulilitoris]|uniref:type II and III secretion system protein family protein n=1 Tax=Aliiruegeria sabulilitoris TaxID=1510458 RepID=UPI000835BC74|nr:type II and III secretion system protein family protein [Aliiruegeria sabulilitoris]NDR57249.1 type II and III secretion system protein family protein [Pseudoruegeria sp. M32A2M]
MTVKTLVRAGLLGFAIAGTSTIPYAAAETLRVTGGTIQRALKVPMNRAVVVESDAPFAELSIANPGIADISTLSERSIYVLGKAPGRTTLTLLAPDGTLITNVEVQVTADVGELKERLREVLPGEAIEVRPANDGIVLSGTVSSAAALDRAIDLANRYAPERVSNLMMVGGTQQVMMKVRFAEMSRTVSKSLGFSAAVNGIAGGGDIGFLGGNGTYLSNNNLSNLFDGDSDTGISLGDGTEGAFQIGFGAGDVEFAVLIEALESKGFVRTLAEPNLTSLSGQAASFLAGGEYPVPISDGDGNISIEYKPFGIVLNMTPRVIGDNINLNLAAEVSAIDESVSYTDSGLTVAGFSTRKTESTVELRDGESFAIAGLLQDDFQDLSTQVPWLGDIPVLGALFRSADYERGQSELVIIVSAHLVTPTRGDALALPTDRVRPPTENQLFMRGITAVTNRPVSGGAGEVARQDFTGSYGYVME